MSRIILAGLLFLLAAGNAIAGEIRDMSFESATLERGYTYSIYLPDDFDAEAETPYPVVYLLHGSFSEALFWTEGLEVADRLDRLIAESAIPPCIVVMPNSLSWWIDGYNEAAETAFFKDLLPHIESRWPVAQSREGRRLAGVSAGGFATINFALKYPDRFAAGAALSPASYEDLPPEGSTAYEHPAFLDADDEFDEQLWRSVNYPALIEQYTTQSTVVPLYINSGDHDALDIAYHAAVLYQRLRQHQPEQLELRIVDGDHEPEVWANTFAEAMQFLFN